MSEPTHTARGWPLPHPDNSARADALRIREAIEKADADLTTLDAKAAASANAITALDTKADASAKAIATFAGRRDNPHGVTAAQVGTMSKSDIDKRLKEEIAKPIEQVSKNLTDFQNKRDNPHGVTAAQVGAYTAEQTDTKITTAVHGLYTKAQVDALISKATPRTYWHLETARHSLNSRWNSGIITPRWRFRANSAIELLMSVPIYLNGADFYSQLHFNCDGKGWRFLGSCKEHGRVWGSTITFSRSFIIEPQSKKDYDISFMFQFRAGGQYAEINRGSEHNYRAIFSAREILV